MSELIQKSAKAEPVKQEASAPVQQYSDIDYELKKLELEEKRLSVKLSKANLVDTEERLAERDLKRENLRMRGVTNGETLRQQNANLKTVQERCNHKKGGSGQEYVGGRGDDDQFAVFRHVFANGDTEVFCLRCKKRWRKPVKSDHATPETFNAAMDEYKKALEFSTRNKPSGGVVFQFSDGGEYYRELTKNG